MSTFLLFRRFGFEGFVFGINGITWIIVVVFVIFTGGNLVILKKSLGSV